MPLIFWPLMWILFMLGLLVAFAIAAMKEAKLRKWAAQEQLARQQAMAGVGMEMNNSSAGVGDVFGDSLDQPGEFADFDENAFK